MSPAEKIAERAAILIVDDDADSRRLCTEILSAAGHECTSAASWREALRLLLENAAPTIILMDRHLPDEDGWRAAARLKAAGHTNWIRIVALTGDVSRESVAGAVDAGCDAFLAKPFEPDALVETVDSMLADEKITGTRRRFPRTD